MTTAPEPLTVPCDNCVDGWYLPWNSRSDDDWARCLACMGTGKRSENNEEMAARLAGDLDEYNRLVAGPE